MDNDSSVLLMNNPSQCVHAEFICLCFKRGNEAVYLKILLSKAFQSILFCFSLSSVCVDFDKSVEPK